MEQKETFFKQTIRENQSRIEGICRHYAPSREDEKDMYQEILVNIWRSLPSFRGDARISTWIYRIAVNTCLTFAGKHYRQMKLNIDIDTSTFRNILPDEEQQSVYTEEDLNNLQLHLHAMNVIDKAIMGLVMEGLSSKEIAEIIGITEPNVRVKIHRIKEELKMKMKGGSHE